MLAGAVVDDRMLWVTLCLITLFTIHSYPLYWSGLPFQRYIVLRRRHGFCVQIFVLVLFNSADEVLLGRLWTYPYLVSGQFKRHQLAQLWCHFPSKLRCLCFGGDIFPSLLLCVYLTDVVIYLYFRSTCFSRALCLTQRHFATVSISPTSVLFNSPSVDRRRSNPQAQDRATERQREVLTNSQSQNKATKQPYKALKSPYASKVQIHNIPETFRDAMQTGTKSSRKFNCFSRT